MARRTADAPHLRDDGELVDRAARFAALGDPVRLALVDDLVTSDRSPAELARRHLLTPSLLAHHLDVLESAGLVVRSVSAGDRRRRYVRLERAAIVGLDALVVPSARAGVQDAVVFICTAASARSQLAAALWRDRSSGRAVAAGTDPAPEVHPGAVTAARRAGVDLPDAAPRSLAEVSIDGALVITVCDRAHEELGARGGWRHWSVADPVAQGTTRAFDACVAELEVHIDALAGAA